MDDGYLKKSFKRNFDVIPEVRTDTYDRETHYSKYRI